MNHRSKHKKTISTNAYFLSILIFFFVMGVYLLSQHREKSIDVVEPTRTPLPTVTSIPLPNTIEEVKNECSEGKCVQSCIAHVNDVIQQAELALPAFYVAEDVDLVYYGISKTDELDKPRKIKVPAEFVTLREHTKAHQLLWSYFKDLFPRETRPNLVNFGIFASSTADGKFDTTLTENWIMKINILSLEDADYLSNALIHEYGHYLTLNATQRDGERTEWGTCIQQPLYYCQPSDSYLNLFYVKFWEDIYSKWADIDQSSANYESNIEAFYKQYEDRFINDYAATDPLEDIAESWTAFVLEPLPTGDGVADRKVRFFYDFPELVQLRYQIIKGICTFEGLPQAQ